MKIFEENNIENDPNYLCINYEEPGVYDHCLERELSKETVRLLSCSPPWFTTTDNLTCSHLLQLEEQTRQEMELLISKINGGRADITNCPVPCRTSW